MLTFDLGESSPVAHTLTSGQDKTGLSFLVALGSPFNFI